MKHHENQVFQIFYTAKDNPLNIEDFSDSVLKTLTGTLVRGMSEESGCTYTTGNLLTHAEIEKELKLMPKTMTKLELDKFVQELQKKHSVKLFGQDPYEFYKNFTSPLQDSN